MKKYLLAVPVLLLTSVGCTSSAGDANSPPLPPPPASTDQTKNIQSNPNLTDSERQRALQSASQGNAEANALRAHSGDAAKQEATMMNGAAGQQKH
jgi:hypothetical protein